MAAGPGAVLDLFPAPLRPLGRSSLRVVRVGGTGDPYRLAEGTVAAPGTAEVSSVGDDAVRLRTAGVDARSDPDDRSGSSRCGTALPGFTRATGLLRPPTPTAAAASSGCGTSVTAAPGSEVPDAAPSAVTRPAGPVAPAVVAPGVTG